MVSGNAVLLKRDVWAALQFPTEAYGKTLSSCSGSCWISAPQATSLGVVISVTGLCVVNQPLDFILQVET